ncbi:transient receptor potential cation channel subfamily V member 1 [Austrofundulus limnaeus]|uniref:Transient receptor potential cation channel subfamily V member 1 n=1 Tax=Austrofundulus limnaeus TaxID=52670 RepID=A0A2I4BUC9_AUSLI|nr:PREDICTED: transient receptor potential cation channel subfamily V member 1-like [Austrofundulus limnaeus]
MERWRQKQVRGLRDRLVRLFFSPLCSDRFCPAEGHILLLLLANSRSAHLERAGPNKALPHAYIHIFYTWGLTLSLDFILNVWTMKAKDKEPTDQKEANKDQRDKEGEDEGWPLKKDDSSSVPMDSNLSGDYGAADSPQSSVFTRDKLFKAASRGDKTKLIGLLEYLQVNKKKLTSSDFTDETNGKTVLLKALLNLKDGINDTVQVFIDTAEKTGDLENLINASYTDAYYKGQTALHVAIERRSLDHVKLLVQNGADVQAKASGKFFQYKSRRGFYFGELPLSLAACTNQPDVVSFLIDNPYRRADPSDKDSLGNTVLHTLVVIADDTKENTEMAARMYDKILLQHYKLEENRGINLESIENKKGLTPLKLAAKLGRIGLFRHMLNREFVDEETRPLSRKFTEWVYGPVHASLYDMSSVDTNENNSVLEIIVFGSQIPNRPEMLQIEPLRSLLRDKWQRFASKLFLMNLGIYLIYLTIFTTVAFYRRDGQPPFPIETPPDDHLRCVGEIISLLGAVWFLYKTIKIFKRNPPNIRALFTDGFSEILFFLQAVLLLVAALLYFIGLREYVGPLAISLALAWINVLYYTRGSRQLGIYNVMMQRMILGDLLHFLCVYSILHFGFSAAVVTLMVDSPVIMKNDTVAQEWSLNVQTFTCRKPSYSDIRFTMLELFKFTIGMGDLEFTDHVQYKEVFNVLLISYIALTYILMLNMLIALMGNTVQKISEQSETIWNLQRAFTILDMEQDLPRCLKRKLQSRGSEIICLGKTQDRCRRFVRVTEKNWKKWRSDVGVKLNEDPVNPVMEGQAEAESPGTPWNINQLMERIWSRRHQQQQNHVL